MRLRYYEEEKRAFPKHHKLFLTPGQAAVLAGVLLEEIGEPPATIILSRHVRNFDRACKATRTIEFHQPRVTAAAVIHEVAHLWHMAHDALHATIVCLFAEVLRTRT